MKHLFVVLFAAAGFLSGGTTITLAQADPAEACRNYGGRIQGDFCVIDVTFCNAALLAADNVCIGREGETIDLGEVVTGPREEAPNENAPRDGNPPPPKG